MKVLWKILKAIVKAVYAAINAAFPLVDERVDQDDATVWFTVVLAILLFALFTGIGALMFDTMKKMNSAIWKFFPVAFIAFLLCRLAVLENEVKDLRKISCNSPGPPKT